MDNGRSLIQVGIAIVTILFTFSLYSQFTHTAIWQRPLFGLQEEKETTDEYVEPRRKIVLIVTYYRSGSTFFGQLFNKNPEAFYLFEPLHPFGYDCNIFYDEKIKVIKHLSLCEVQKLREAYLHAHAILKTNDYIFKCVKAGICFPEFVPKIREQLRSLCYTNGSRGLNGILDEDELVNASIRIQNGEDTGNVIGKPLQCRMPYNATLEEALCKISRITAYKILRICDMEQVERAYKDLKALGEDVYVIHLGRDIRPTLASGIKLEIKRQKLSAAALMYCNRYRNKIQFSQNKSNELIKDNKFLQVRHEDLTLNLTKEVERIYRFIGEPLHPTIGHWVEETSMEPSDLLKKYRNMLATNTTITAKERTKLNQQIQKLLRDMRSSYGTVRSANTVLNKWRTYLTFPEVDLIQKTCPDVFQEYGYKIIQTEEEFLNKNLTFW